MALVRTNEVDIAKSRLMATIVCLNSKDYIKLKQIFTYLQPEDAAWILSNLNEAQRYEVASTLGSALNARILAFLDQKTRKNVIRNLKYDFSFTQDGLLETDREESIQQRVFHTTKALVENDKVRLKQIFDYLQPTDAATVFEFLTSGQRSKAIKLLGSNFQPKILTFLDSNVREEIMDQLDYESLIHFVAELDYSEVVEILESVDTNKQKEILESISKLIDKDILKSIKKSLYYDEDTAGRIMNPGMSFPATQMVKEVYNKFCANKKLPKESQIIYVHDNNSESYKFKLIGQLYVSELCKLSQSKHARSESIYKYTHDIPCILYTNTKLEEIGFLFKKYFVPEMPVINPKNYRLMGTVNANQAMDILDTATEEEILSLAGLQEFDFHDSISRTIMTRLQWLSVASIATVASVSVIHFFEDTIKYNPTLAVLMPIAPAIGGNAAAQVLTVTVRALANREIGRANLWRTIRKEFLSNFGSGVVIGTSIGLLSYLYYKRLDISLILGISLTVNICWAGLVGSGIPIALDKYDKDPAVASVFLSITTDIIGYAVLLSMAGIFTK